MGSFSLEIDRALPALFRDVLGTRRRNAIDCNAVCRPTSCQAIGYAPPPGFEAYARVLHPIDTGDHLDPAVTWTEVADALGCPLTASTTWQELADHAAEVFGPDHPWWYGPAAMGLPARQATALAHALGQLSDVRECAFGGWLGFADLDGWFHEAVSVEVAGRGTYLLVGELSDASTNVYQRDCIVPGYRSVNVWLPPRLPWLVTTEIYSTNSVVAASAEVIAILRDVPELEILPIAAEDVQSII